MPRTFAGALIINVLIDKMRQCCHDSVYHPLSSLRFAFSSEMLVLISSYTVFYLDDTLKKQKDKIVSCTAHTSVTDGSFTDAIYYSHIELLK